MQKKLEAELMSLAHRILKLKKGGDVRVLKEIAGEVYEKISVLDFIATYVRETPQNTKTVETLIKETFDKPTIVEDIKESCDNNADNVTEGTKDSEDLINLQEINDDLTEKSTLQSSFEKEFKDTVSLDVTKDLFENAQRISQKKSVNDLIMSQKSLQIDLNDRIAFVKNLFNNSQEELNRVVSQLNTMSSEREALSLLKMVKKEYNWDGQEVYEERLLMLIERKFN